jgi:tellurite resistance protein TerC
MTTGILPWLSFNLLVLAMLALDLAVFHRKAHEVKLKEALIWSAVWIVLALLFSAGISAWRGPQAALEFLTGYLIEKSLSVDNILVFVLIFSSLRVSSLHQHKVLFWGIVGALVMRATLIAAGVTLVRRFYWVSYVLGAFLILTGIKMALQKHKDMRPERNSLLRLIRRSIPVTEDDDTGKFFARRAARWHATPLFIVLLFVETMDLIFAVDSIPAILAITPDPFIVYTSNVFAILGLRSLYFVLAGIMRSFHYLHYGLAIVVVFVGAKMLLSGVVRIPVGISLGVTAGALAISVAASILKPRGKPKSDQLDSDRNTDEAL